MDDGKTNETDTPGEEVDKTVETPDTPAELVRKEREELKKENDAYEAEKLRAEKLRAEKARGGRSEAGKPQLTGAEEIEAKAKDDAQEIVDAFR